MSDRAFSCRNLWGDSDKHCPHNERETERESESQKEMSRERISFMKGDPAWLGLTWHEAQDLFLLTMPKQVALDWLG